MWRLNITVVLTIMACAISIPSRTATTGTSAETAWGPFLTSLRVAVQKKDRAALMNMMPRDFSYDCCDSDDTNRNGDTRDEAFRLWDRPSIAGWAKLSHVLAQGAVPIPGYPDAGRKPPPRRTAPPAAKGNRYRGWIATFEYRDGRWYFISFGVPEND